MTYNPRRKAVIFLICTASLWSLGGLLIKSISWHPLAIAGARSLIAAVLMFAYRRKFTFTWSVAQIGAAIAYAGTVILFVAANKLTTAANAILIQYTAPIYVALFGSWFLGEKTELSDWLTIGVTLGGMGLFFVDRLSAGNLWGNILAVGSGVFFAGVPLFLRKQKNGSTIESLFLGNILTGIIGLPFMFQAAPGGAGWIGLVVLGIFQLGLSYILYAEAVKYVTALEAILIPIIEPILNPIWVFLLLHETPGKWAMVGGLVVLAAVTVRCVRGLKVNRSLKGEV